MSVLVCAFSPLFLFSLLLLCFVLFVFSGFPLSISLCLAQHSTNPPSIRFKAFVVWFHSFCPLPFLHIVVTPKMIYRGMLFGERTLSFTICFILFVSCSQRMNVIKCVNECDVPTTFLLFFVGIGSCLQAEAIKLFVAFQERNAMSHRCNALRGDTRSLHTFIVV